MKLSVLTITGVNWAAANDMAKTNDRDLVTAKLDRENMKLTDPSAVLHGLGYLFDLKPEQVQDIYHLTLAMEFDVNETGRGLPLTLATLIGRPVVAHGQFTYFHGSLTVWIAGAIRLCNSPRLDCRQAGNQIVNCINATGLRELFDGYELIHKTDGTFTLQVRRR